jgi:hypothetical protein
VTASVENHIFEHGAACAALQLADLSFQKDYFHEYAA